MPASPSMCADEPLSLYGTSLRLNGSDSFAFGTGVKEGQRASDYLQADLRAAGVNSEVYNFGVPGLEINPVMILHGEQYLEIRKPIPVSGKLTTKPKIAAVWDKTKGAVIELDADTVDGIHASATATANKLLALNASSKLPASITGDSDNVDSFHASATPTANYLLVLNGSAKVEANDLLLLLQALKEGVTKDEAETMKAKLEEQGATVEIK